MAAFLPLPSAPARFASWRPVVAVSAAPPAAAPALATAAHLLRSTPANFLLIPPTDPPLAAAAAAVRRAGGPPPPPAAAVPRVAVPPALRWAVPPRLCRATPLPSPLDVVAAGDAAGTAALAAAFAAAGAPPPAVAAVAAAAAAAAAAHAAAVGVTPANVRLRLAVVDAVPCPRWHADKVRLRGLTTLWGGGTLWVDETAVAGGSPGGGGGGALPACGAPPGGCGCEAPAAATAADAAAAAAVVGWGLPRDVRAAVLGRGPAGAAPADGDEVAERAAMEAAGGVVRQAPVGALLFLKGGGWGADGGGAIHRSPGLAEGAGGGGRLILQTDDGM